jgi:hypothetical protein
MRNMAGAVALLAALGGCASVVKGTDQQVLVETTPEGASCVLQNDKGSYPVARAFSCRIESIGDSAPWRNG